MLYSPPSHAEFRLSFGILLHAIGTVFWTLRTKVVSPHRWESVDTEEPVDSFHILNDFVLRQGLCGPTVRPNDIKIRTKIAESRNGFGLKSSNPLLNVHTLTSGAS